MNKLRNELLAAYQAGNFLECVYAKWMADKDERDVLASALIALQNSHSVDVVGEFELLKPKVGSGPLFFLTRHLFEEVLPELDAAIPAVMRCVSQLYKDAGQDGAAGLILNSFTDFCVKASNRPRDALKEIEKHPDELIDLLPATLAAGARLDSSHYLGETIRLSKSNNIEFKRRAVFSLGRLQREDGAAASDLAISCLEGSVENELDDLVLANVIHSGYALLQYDQAQESRVLTLIASALSKGGDSALHAAAVLFGIHINDLPDSLLNALLPHLKNVKATNIATLRNLDYGIAHLLKGAHSEKAVTFLEDYLLSHPKQSITEMFEGASNEVRANSALMSKILTRWLLCGDPALCRSIRDIVGAHYGDELRLTIDPAELRSKDDPHILFVARKAVGYLFWQPVSAASILLSLMRFKLDDEILAELGALLFDPLLLNFTGKAYEYVAQQTEDEDEKIKKILDSALEKLDAYLEAIRRVGNLPALHPSEAQREAYHRYFSRIMANSVKTAEEQSVFLGLVSKKMLLYGKKSINYVYQSNEVPRRMEIPLTPHSTEIEVARGEILDPYGLDYMLRIFRSEQVKT